MSSYTALTEKAATQLLETVQPVEELALTLVAAARNATSKVTSKASTLPFADVLPTPAEVLVASAAFGERLLAAQKDFGQRLLVASTPIAVVPSQSTSSTSAKAPAAAKV